MEVKTYTAVCRRVGDWWAISVPELKDHATGMVLGQRQVADKRGESTAIEPLLSGLPAGVVWTLDALHTGCVFFEDRSIRTC